MTVSRILNQSFFANGKAEPAVLPAGISPSVINSYVYSANAGSGSDDRGGLKRLTTPAAPERRLQVDFSLSRKPKFNNAALGLIIFGDRARDRFGIGLSAPVELTVPVRSAKPSVP